MSEESLKSALIGSNAPRAMLVSLSHGGELEYQPVEHGQSVLNLETELLALW